MDIDIEKNMSIKGRGRYYADFEPKVESMKNVENNVQSWRLCVKTDCIDGPRKVGGLRDDGLHWPGCNK